MDRTQDDPIISKVSATSSRLSDFPNELLHLILTNPTLTYSEQDSGRSVCRGWQKKLDEWSKTDRKKSIRVWVSIPSIKRNFAGLQLLTRIKRLEIGTTYSNETSCDCSPPDIAHDSISRMMADFQHQSNDVSARKLLSSLLLGVEIDELVLRFHNRSGRACSPAGAFSTCKLASLSGARSTLLTSAGYGGEYPSIFCLKDSETDNDEKVFDSVGDAWGISRMTMGFLNDHPAGPAHVMEVLADSLMDQAGKGRILQAKLTAPNGDACDQLTLEKLSEAT